MKSLLTSIFLLVIGSVFGQDQWLPVDSINGAPRSVATSFVLGGEGYAIGGLDIGGFRRKMYSYNYLENDWDDEESIGGANGNGLNRGSASAFSIDEKGYVCLGQGLSNGFFKDLWEFDPVTDAWSQKANFMGTARRQAVAFAIDGFAYVGTGIDQNGFTKDFYKYDPTINTWTQLNDFGGTARKEAVGFSMGGQAYVGTGDDGILLNDFWEYTAATDQWIQLADFPGTPRKGAVGFGMFPQAFIATGEDNTFQFTNDVWEYNYFSNAWVQRSDFSGPGRSNAISFVLGDVAFVGSGYNGDFMDDMYAYRALLSTDELEKYADANVYPNPANEGVTINVETAELSVHLYSIDGKELTDAIQIQQTNNSFFIDRGVLPTGSYMIRLEHEMHGGVYQGKVLFL
ncbi:MAG: T9SS type A sorting domain-containing protein [Crocinitomicaceae bacterium]|nr:T9SS type A sorting domain-containing protein [Crocinitomicaceae bacterium]